VTDQEKKAMGRPTKFDPKFLPIVKKMAELGATDPEIAEALQIDVVTVWRWKCDNEDFCNALKVGKEHADERVKRALFSRALGYSHPEDDIKQVNGQIVITPTIKHYPPDTTACIFWLKNRLPEEFRANPEPGEDDYVAPVKIEVSVVDATKPKA